MNNIPTCIIITGLAGSGKTTLSRQLAREFCLPYIDYDTVTEPLLARVHREHATSLNYVDFTRHWRAESYEVFWGTIAENLNLGISLIASGPCGQEIRDPGFFNGYRSQYGIRDMRILNLHLLPDEKLLQTFKRNRNLDRDSFHASNWESFIKSELQTSPVWDADYVETIRFSRADDLWSISKQIISDHIHGGI